jgi:hypothetical protein
VGNAEEDAALLKPGQPYSVYPKRIARLDESTVKINSTETSPPLRTEGPLINIQWTTTAIDHDINSSSPGGNHVDSVLET